MKFLKKAIICLMISVLILSLTSCKGEKSKIKDTLLEFEYSCQNLDVNGMLNCIDPDVAQPIKAVLLMYGMSTGEDTSEVLDELVKTVFGESFKADEFLSHLTVDKVKIKVSGNTAIVNCRLNFEVEGETFTKYARINMVKLDDKWYISGIQLLKSDEVE